MKKALLLLSFAIAMRAQQLQVFLHTPGETADGTPVSATFRFSDTPVGAQSTVTLRVKNTSSTQTFWVKALYASDNTDFLSSAFAGYCMAPGKFQDVLFSFSPSTVGILSSPLVLGYKAYPVSAGCPDPGPTNVDVDTLLTLTGTGLAPTLSVNLTLDGMAGPIRAGTAINFGNVPLGGSKTATVTLQNSTSEVLDNPKPSLLSPEFSQSPYFLNSVENWPSRLLPGESVSFTLGFSPSQLALVTDTLSLGTARTYPLNGFGVAGTGSQSLTVEYTWPTGVRYPITTASPVDFGSSLTGTSQTFLFTVTNPATNFDSVIIPSVALSGTGFRLANLPALPVTLAPGSQITFGVVFSPTVAGAQQATLSIGTLVFSLNATATSPTLDATLHLTPAFLKSGQQATLSIELAKPASTARIATLTLSFTSAIADIADDPAILFASTGGRNMNVTFAQNSTAGVFPDGEDAIVFQTGTTAGTLTFTLSFGDGETYSKAVDIAGTPVQVTTATGLRQSPYLVLNLTAFDNTYSAGKLSFNFYDTAGKLITPSPISIDETKDFHDYFFTNNTAGGAFALQARFPVTGDISTIAAMDVTVQNASGPSQTQRITF